MSEVINVRASSLRELLDCPARWEAKHVRKLRTKSSANAQLGRAIHRGAEVYDRSYIEGAGLTVSDAEGELVDTLHRDRGEVDWGEDNPQSAEEIGRALLRRYAAEVTPTANYKAVEVRCERLEISDLGIALTGTTDRIHAAEGGLGIDDIKTGKTAVRADGTVSAAGHAVQLGAYEVMAQFASGLPITTPARIRGLQVAKTERGRRIGVAEVEDARGLLIGDADRPGILEYAAKLLRGGLFYGNPNSMMCDRKYCPAFETCPFRR